MKFSQFFRSYLLPLLVLSFLSPLVAGCYIPQAQRCFFTYLDQPQPRWEPPPDPYVGHYIMVAPNGFPSDLDGKLIMDEDFEKHYVDKIVEGINSHVQKRKTDNEPARILFFVHGGLNTRENQAEHMSDLVSKNDKVLSGSSYYPVLINWESSAPRALGDYLFQVRQGLVPRDNWDCVWRGVSVPFIASAGLGASVLDAPRGLYDMFKNFSHSFDRAKWYEDVIHLLLIPVRFVTVPFIEAFGSPTWEILKRRTDFLVKRETRKKGDTEETEKQGDTEKDKEDGALTTLMKKLKCNPFEHGEEDPTRTKQNTKCIRLDRGKAKWVISQDDHGDRKEVPIDITLVGHSMGTLVLDSLLLVLPDLPFKRIIYLASASSIDDVQYSILPYLRRHKKAEFYAFSLSEGDEVREVNGRCPLEEVCLPSFLDPLERGSLLVWIDSFLEDIYRPYQLRFGRGQNLARANYAPPRDVKNRFRYITFKGESDEPKLHTGFTEPLILQRILYSVDPCAFRLGLEPYPYPGLKSICERTP